jgi:hypothetical protein
MDMEAREKLGISVEQFLEAGHVDDLNRQDI